MGVQAAATKELQKKLVKLEEDLRHANLRSSDSMLRVVTERKKLLEVRIPRHTHAKNTFAGRIMAISASNA